MGFKKSQVIKALIFSVILIFVGYLIPQMVGLGAGGFDVDKTLQQFTFYLSGAIFLIGILLLVFVEAIINHKDKRYGDSVAFVSPGDKPALPIFKKIGLFNLFFISLIIFSIVGFIASVTQQTAFTEFASLEQQFTPQSQLLFSSLLVPIAENLGLAFMIGFTIFGIRWFGRKTNMTTANFRIFTIFLVPLIAGTFGYINHLLRYSGSDTALVTVFMFWFFGGLITVLTGSFIPFWMMHFANNFFFDLKNIFGSDIHVTYGITIIIVSIMVYVGYYFGVKKLIKKKSGGEVYG